MLINDYAGPDICIQRGLLSSYHRELTAASKKGLNFGDKDILTRGYFHFYCAGVSFGKPSTPSSIENELVPVNVSYGDK